MAGGVRGDGGAGRAEPVSGPPPGFDRRVRRHAAGHHSDGGGDTAARLQNDQRPVVDDPRWHGRLPCLRAVRRGVVRAGDRLDQGRRHGGVRDLPARRDRLHRLNHRPALQGPRAG